MKLETVLLVIVDTFGDNPVFSAVKGKIVPEPLAPKPVLVLLFVQV